MQVQYYFQLAQQHNAALQQHSPTNAGGATTQTVVQQVQQVQQSQPQIQIVQQAGNTQTVQMQAGTPTLSVPSILQLQTASSF